MASNNKRRLGDILVASGRLTIEQLEEALRAQRILGKKLGTILVERNMISEQDILEAIEQQIGIPKVDLNNIDLDGKAINLVSENLCRKHSLIPFGFNGVNKIKVAMVDPLNLFAVDDVNISTGFEVETYISLEKDIRKFIDNNNKKYEQRFRNEGIGKDKVTKNITNTKDATYYGHVMDEASNEGICKTKVKIQMYDDEKPYCIIDEDNKNLWYSAIGTNQQRTIAVECYVKDGIEAPVDKTKITTNKNLGTISK